MLLLRRALGQVLLLLLRRRAWALMRAWALLRAWAL